MSLEDSLGGSLKHVRDIHIGFIIRKHLPKATESMLSTLVRVGQRREGRAGGVVPLGRTLRSTDTPGLPLLRCSANQIIPAPWGMRWGGGGFLTKATFEPSTIQPKAAKQIGSRKGLEIFQSETVTLAANT